MLNCSLGDELDPNPRIRTELAFWPRLTMDQFAARKRLALRVRRYYRTVKQLVQVADHRDDTVGHAQRDVEDTSPSCPTDRLHEDAITDFPAPVISSYFSEAADVSDSSLGTTGSEIADEIALNRFANAISHARRVSISNRLRSIEKEFLYTIGYL